MAQLMQMSFKTQTKWSFSPFKTVGTERPRKKPVRLILSQS